MTPIGYSFPLLALTVAILTVMLLERLVKPRLDIGKFRSIAGLRGYLAFFVFLHHSCIWYFYLQNEDWRAPPSNLFNYFGVGSVVMFFMVTGFLFFSKILNGLETPLNWKGLYVARVCRIAPLYLFSIICVLLIVWAITHGKLNQSPWALVRRVAMASCLGVFDLPDLNGVKSTALIVARVFWSLQYEWFFYCSLPLLALCAGAQVPSRYFIFLAGSAVFLLTLRNSFTTLVPFLGGLLAAVLVRDERIRMLCRANPLALLVIAAVCVPVLYIQDPFDLRALALFSVAFLLIAGGNSLFGLFENRLSYILGEISFSIYLLHGILLYVALNFVIGLESAKRLAPDEYCLVIVALVPVLVVVSFGTYRLIELPGMRLADRIMGKLEKA